MNSKTIEILRTFDAEEFKKLGKFLASPYFNHARDLVPLYKELKPFYPEFDQPNFSRKFLYEKLYPGKEFGDAKSESLIKTLFSDLFKSCKEFLTQLGSERDKDKRAYYKLEQLRERKLYKDYEKEYPVMKKDLRDTGEMDLGILLNLYHSKDLETAFSIEMGNPGKVIDAMVSGAEFLLMAAFVRTYRSSDIKKIAHAFNVEYKNNFIDTFLKNLDSEKMLAELYEEDSEFYPYMAVYHALYKMNILADKKYYFEAKHLLDKYIYLFSRNELYILFSMMSSYCARQSGRDHYKWFTKEEFEIYDKTLKLGIYRYSEKDDFQAHNFRNMVLTSLDVDEIEWLENFIEKYSKELNPEYRSSMKHYSLAHLYFAKGEFEKALDEISKVKYNYFLFPMDLKYLTFRIYYELNYDEQALSALNNIASYLVNTKDLSVGFRERGGAFTKFSRELLRRKMEGNTDELELFRKKIIEAEDVNSRRWLVAKADELGK